MSIGSALNPSNEVGEDGTSMSMSMLGSALNPSNEDGEDGIKCEGMGLGSRRLGCGEDGKGVICAPVSGSNTLAGCFACMCLVRPLLVLKYRGQRGHERVGGGEPMV